MCVSSPHVVVVSLSLVPSLLLLLAQQLENDAKDDFILTNIIMPMLRCGKLNRHYARRRGICYRRSWSSFQSAPTDRQFRLYFRMSKELFQRLCDEIEVVVGEYEFKSKEFLNELKNSALKNRDDPPSAYVRMLIANEFTTGGFISGEIKLATALRVLGGGSPLDMAILFDTSFGTAYKMFHMSLLIGCCMNCFTLLMALNTAQIMPAWRVWLYNFARHHQES